MYLAIKFGYKKYLKRKAMEYMMDNGDKDNFNYNSSNGNGNN